MITSNTAVGSRGSYRPLTDVLSPVRDGHGRTRLASWEGVDLESHAGRPHWGSLGDINEHKQKISLSKGGEVTKIDPVVPETGFRRGGGVRGQVSRFTKKSSKRMSLRIKAVDQSMITGVFWGGLTSSELTWENVESRRRAWERKFKRQWGHLRYFILWRKEPHESGAPHMHVMIYWVDPLPHYVSWRSWNDQAWASVQGDPESARAGCRFEMLQNKGSKGVAWRSVSVYLSKYLAKKSELQVSGRQWGIINRQVYKSCVDWEEHEVVQGVAVIYQRLCRKLVERRLRHAWTICRGEYMNRLPWDEGVFFNRLYKEAGVEVDGDGKPFHQVRFKARRLTWKSPAFARSLMTDDRGHQTWEIVPQPGTNICAKDFFICYADQVRLLDCAKSSWTDQH